LYRDVDWFEIVGYSKKDRTKALTLIVCTVNKMKLCRVFKAHIDIKGELTSKAN